MDSTHNAVAHVPDWPVLLCYTHHFYSPPEWGDEHLLGLVLPDFSDHWIWTSELIPKLPVNQGVPKNYRLGGVGDAKADACAERHCIV